MARFNKGFVKIHRSILEGDLGTHPQIAFLFINLILLANWKESKLYWQGDQITLPPGTVVCGASELAKKLQTSRSSIQRWLQYLVDTSRIGQQTGNQGTIITILNYSKYQDQENNVGSEWVADGPPMGSGRALSKEGKKVRRKEIYTPEFEAIWLEYPRRVGKEDAFKSFSKKVEPQDFELAMKSVKNYKAYHQKKKTEEQYIAHMSTYFNKGTWKDYIDPQSQLNLETKQDFFAEFAEEQM